MDKSLFEENYANYLFWRHRLMPMAKAVCEKTGDVNVYWHDDAFCIVFEAKHTTQGTRYRVAMMLSPVDIRMMHREHFGWKIRALLKELCEAIEKKQLHRFF